jgi:hypothetical protein
VSVSLHDVLRVVLAVRRIVYSSREFQADIQKALLRKVNPDEGCALWEKSGKIFYSVIGTHDSSSYSTKMALWFLSWVSSLMLTTAHTQKPMSC